MSTSGSETSANPVQAHGLHMGEKEFVVLLGDDRRIVVPYVYFPRLARATPEQRRHFEVYSDGKMLHWPDIDEDIEVQHLVEGRFPVKASGTAPAR